MRTTTALQNPSEPAAVVSFRDDYIKWGRIEVSWWGRVLPLIIPFAEEIVYKRNQRKNGMIRLILWIVIYGGAMFLAVGLGVAFL